MSTRRGLKTVGIHARFTRHQRAKLEQIAILKDTNISGVLRALVDGAVVDVKLSQQNSNADGVRQDIPIGIAH